MLLLLFKLFDVFIYIMEVPQTFKEFPESATQTRLKAVKWRGH